MTSSSRKQFGILTKEDLGAITVIRKERRFHCETDALSRLPDEILILILSEIITGCVYLYQDGFPHSLRSAGYLRQVCRRFRKLIDELMFNTPLRQILLIGPVSGDYAELKTIYREYRNNLWTRLRRTNPENIPLITIVHFIPCLDTSASVNWFRDNNLAVQLKDALAAQKAITAHQAAALILSRIMQEVIHKRFQGDREVIIGLVFHEVDGTWLRWDQYFEKRHCHPEFMPFWDSDGMQLILNEWRWIFQFPSKNHPFCVQVVLPNIAWATSSRPENELEAANKCVTDLYEAWTLDDNPTHGEEQAFNSDQGQTQCKHMIRIPGFPRPVNFPTNSLYAKWLGVLTKEDTRLFCFTLRGLMVGIDSDGEISILKRVYRPPFKSTTSSNDPISLAADTEKMRPHQAVLLKRPERTPVVMSS